MIAPKKIDLFCEILQALQPVFVLLVGGPTALAGIMIAQGADTATVMAFMNTIHIPLWVVPACALAAWIDGLLLKMCYPGVSLPTSAVIAQVEAAAQAWLTAHPQQAPTVTVTTPDLGPEHPPTQIVVSPPAVETPPA